MSGESIIEVVGVGKKYIKRNSQSYPTAREQLMKLFRSPWKLLDSPRKEEFWALKDISFEVKPGEVVGIIGRNGSGKSTLLKILSRITEPTEGYVKLRGRVSSLLEVGTGFHPELTGRENIFFNGTILGMSRKEIQSKFDAIVNFADIGDFLDIPLKYYSNGMAMRLAFAVAAHLDPDILIIDEVLAVGDLEFQNKCLNKAEEISSNSGRTILFVSHQMSQIRRLCHKVIWIDQGHIRAIGGTAEVIGEYEKFFLSTDRDLSSAQRLNQKAAFRQWYIQDSGQKVHVLSHFDSVKVVFALEVYKLLHQPLIDIALKNAAGQILWGHRTQHSSLSIGSYELEFLFAFLPLSRGMYSWHISVYDLEGKVDVWEGLPMMQVELPSYQHHSDQWSGIMNLPYKLELRQLSEIDGYLLR
ncbi:MAG: ABC transporter ATP-binding protein [Bacteroidia bacterium]